MTLALFCQSTFEAHVFVVVIAASVVAYSVLGIAAWSPRWAR